MTFFRIKRIIAGALLLVAAGIVVPEVANAAAAGFSTLGSNGGIYSAGGKLTFGKPVGTPSYGYSTSYKVVTIKGKSYYKLVKAKAYMNDSYGTLKAGTYSGNAQAGQPKD